MPLWTKPVELALTVRLFVSASPCMIINGLFAEDRLPQQGNAVECVAVTGTSLRGSLCRPDTAIDTYCQHTRWFQCGLRLGCFLMIMYSRCTGVFINLDLSSNCIHKHRFFSHADTQAHTCNSEMQVPVHL